MSHHLLNFTELMDVYEFQRKFSVPMAMYPSFLDPAAIDFRIKFLQEELDEFKQAILEKDMHKAADALVDLEYVLKGTVLMMGLGDAWPHLWAMVQEANMRKVRATDPTASKRGSALDVVKPVGWVAPNFTRILGDVNRPWPLFQATPDTGP